MCKLLTIPCEAVSSQNHRAVRVERFFKYLNKMEKITVANTQSFLTWLQGTMFSLYGWNASPINGTNLIRSFVAKGRMFPFPIDLALDPIPRLLGSEGTPALEYVQSLGPVIQRQRHMLQLLNDERRQRHRELRNKSAVQRTFQPGDLVIVRRQVQSDAAEGKVAKLMFKATGPYIVLKALTPASYQVCKIPFVEGAGRRGKPRKVNAVLMQSIPSTLCVHKQVDGAGARFAGLDEAAVLNPLEQALGAHQFGRYCRQHAGEPPDEQPFAFVKIEDIWAEEVQSSESEDYGDSEEDNVPPQDPPDDDDASPPRPPEPP